MKILILEQDEKTLQSLGYIFYEHHPVLVTNDLDFMIAIFDHSYDKILINIDYLGAVLDTVRELGIRNVVYTTANTIDFGVAPLLKKPYGVEDIERLIYT